MKETVESEKEKPKKKKRKKAKKRSKKEKRAKADSGSEDESSTTSEGSDPTSESDSSSTDESVASNSSSAGQSQSRTKEQKAKEAAIWERLKDIWVMGERPAHMKNRKGIVDMSLSEIIKYKEHYEKEAEKRGVGGAIFGQDQKLKAKAFKKQNDNGSSKLHPARWERLPMVPPRKYWKKVPKKRDDIFRHLHLAHYGAEGMVNEATLVRLHDRYL